MTQNKNDSKSSILQHGLNTAAWSYGSEKLLCSISYFRISIIDPVSQPVQMEGS